MGKASSCSLGEERDDPAVSGRAAEAEVDCEDAVVEAVVDRPCKKRLCAEEKEALDDEEESEEEEVEAEEKEEGEEAGCAKKRGESSFASSLFFFQEG